MEAIHLTLRRVYLNLASLTTNILTLLLMFFIPTLFCLGTTVIAPFYPNFGYIITTTAMLSGFIVYGTVAGTFRRSTLNKNSDLTMGVKWIDNLTTIITMLIMAFIMVNYELILFTIFDSIHILILLDHPDLQLWHDLSITLVYYWMFITVIITYSISYFIQGFFDSDMFFFTVAVVFTIGMMILGATIFSYFAYKGQYKPKAEIPGIEGTDNFNKYPFMYWISLAFPFYTPSQMMRLQGDALLRGLDPTSIWCWANIDEHAWQFNILWFVPYGHIIIWWISGFIYKWFKH